jgi:hypothetical protein
MPSTYVHTKKQGHLLVAKSKSTKKRLASEWCRMVATVLALRRVVLSSTLAMGNWARRSISYMARYFRISCNLHFPCKQAVLCETS